MRGGQIVKGYSGQSQEYGGYGHERQFCKASCFLPVGRSEVLAMVLWVPLLLSWPSILVLIPVLSAAEVTECLHPWHLFQFCLWSRKSRRPACISAFRTIPYVELVLVVCLLSARG